MNVGVFLLAVLGGGIGASLRFIIDGAIMRGVRSGYPWGTFLINATGAAILGLLTGLTDSSVLDSSWLFILGGGVMGGYTTFSTAMVDTVHMLQRRAWGHALFNGIGMLVVTVALALAGLLLGRSL